MLERLDRALTRVEVALVVGVLAALVGSLLAWVVLKGLATRTEGEVLAGFVFRAGLLMVLGGSLAWWRFKSSRVTSAVLLVAVALGWLARDVGTAWAANVLAWLQDGSLLTWCGGLRGVGTRLTLVLGMLGAALATASGRHVAIDAVSRALKGSLRTALARLGGVVAAFVCLTAAWGFFDFTAIDAFHAAPTASGGEKWSATVGGVGRHGALAWRQLRLDLKMVGRVVGGAPWDHSLTAAEWNDWLGDSEELAGLKESDASVMRTPLLALPGESPRGLLVKDLNLVVPLGLLWLALRFLLWVLRGAPAEGAHA